MVDCNLPVSARNIALIAVIVTGPPPPSTSSSSSRLSGGGITRSFGCRRCFRSSDSAGEDAVLFCGVVTFSPGMKSPRTTGGLDNEAISKTAPKAPAKTQKSPKQISSKNPKNVQLKLLQFKCYQ